MIGTGRKVGHTLFLYVPRSVWIEHKRKNPKIAYNFSKFNNPLESKLQLFSTQLTEQPLIYAHRNI